MTNFILGAVLLISYYAVRNIAKARAQEKAGLPLKNADLVFGALSTGMLLASAAINLAEKMIGKEACLRDTENWTPGYIMIPVSLLCLVWCYKLLVRYLIAAG